MDVKLTDDAIAIDLTRLEQLLALARPFTVPLHAVSGVDVVARRDAEQHRGIRAPGTAVPRRIAAGTWRVRGAKQFWNVRRAERVLTIDLVGERYSKLVLEVADPDTLADRIRGRLAAAA